MSRNDAFTLLECILVLCLLSIIVALVLPSEVSFFQKNNANIIKDKLFQGIQLARNEALVRNEIIVLCPSQNHQSCSDEWKEGFIIKTSNQVLFSFAIRFSKGSLSWRGFPSNRQELVFFPNGYSNIENGSFVYEINHHIEWSIKVNQAGRARILSFPPPQRRE